MAQRLLRTCLLDVRINQFYAAKYPLGSDAILNQCYVDNILCGADNKKIV